MKEKHNMSLRGGGRGATISNSNSTFNSTSTSTSISNSTDAPPVTRLPPPEKGGQLVSNSEMVRQPATLTGNPDISHFTFMYRLHTCFAMESIEQVFGGVANFGKCVTSTIPRNGDLVGSMTLHVTLPGFTAKDAGVGTKFSWVPFVGEFLIQSVSIEIGGQELDKQYGEWLHIWSELTTPVTRNYRHMVNGLGGVEVEVVPSEKADTKTLTEVLNESIAGLECRYKLSEDGVFPEQRLQIPLNFWFNRNPGLTLPLIALAYHEVRLTVQFEHLERLFNTTRPELLRTIKEKGIQDAFYYVDYILLDTVERGRFAQCGHEYLIEQVQRVDVPIQSPISRVPISFFHPVKELIWTLKTPVDQERCDILSTSLLVDGVKCFTVRAGDNQALQILHHHTGSPSRGIHVYSFALNPEKQHPSGTMNFSCLNNVAMEIHRTKAPGLLDFVDPGPELHVYALNKNVLRIISGMAGLAYSWLRSSEV